MSTNALLLMRSFSTLNSAKGLSQGVRSFSSQTATSSAQSAGIPNTIIESTAEEIISGQGKEPEIISKLRSRYTGIKRSRISKAFLALDIDRDIVPAEEKLISAYRFLKEEVNFVMRYNPKFILFEQTAETGIKNLQSFFVDKLGFQLETVRTLVVRYPYVLSKTQAELEHFFTVMKGQGLNEEEAMKALLECPKLVSKKDLEKQIKEIQFLFNLYHQISQQEVNEIFRAFPYLYLCETQKIQKFMGEFRKYNFTKDQVIKVSKESGGILASRVSNFVGLFDLLKKNYGVKASDVKYIISTYPEFIL